MMQKISDNSGKDSELEARFLELDDKCTEKPLVRKERDWVKGLGT